MTLGVITLLFSTARVLFLASWNISLRQYSVLMDFHTSVSRISAESWLMLIQPRSSSIFLTLSLFMRLENTQESQHVIEDDSDAIYAGGSWVGGFDFDWTEDAEAIAQG